jgi:hypothetical protein
MWPSLVYKGFTESNLDIWRKYLKENKVLPNKSAHVSSFLVVSDAPFE